MEEVQSCSASVVQRHGQNMSAGHTSCAHHALWMRYGRVVYAVSEGDVDFHLRLE